MFDKPTKTGNLKFILAAKSEESDFSDSKNELAICIY